MGRRKNGQFGGGGREDFAPELAMERYWNRHDVAFLTNASDSTTRQTTSFPTGMEVEEGGDDDRRIVGRKWVIKGAVFQPGSVDSLDNSQLYQVYGMQVTLQLPGHEGQLLVPGDRGYIGRAMLHADLVGTPADQAFGVIAWPLPLDILTPVPVFSETLDVQVRTGIDAAAYRSKDFVLSIIYGWADAYISDVIAARQLNV